MNNYLEPHQLSRELDQKIIDLNSKIDQANDNYDSLNQFKNTVEQSKEDFDMINGKTQSVLAPLDSLKNNSTIAAKYQNGMTRSLTGIGMKIVSGAFSALLTMIAAEKVFYHEKALFYDGQIRLLQNEKAKADNVAALIDTGTG